MTRREEMIRSLKQHLLKAQHRMKQLADHHRTDKVFQVGEWVWLKLQPYRQMSVQLRSSLKLGPKYFGPFQISERIGPAAYKLLLPDQAQIHPTIHVSQLKSFREVLPAHPYIPDWLRNTRVDATLQPYKILARRVVKRHNKPAVQYLIRWNSQIEEQATWIFEEDFEMHVDFEYKTQEGG